MHLLQAFILGIVEGLTEFLPISSTAHLVIAGRLLHSTNSIFFQTFSIFIQIGAIGAVLLTSFQQFFKQKVFVRIVTAFVPTVIVGLLLHDTIHKFFFGSLSIIGLALILGAFLIPVIDKKKNNPTTTREGTVVWEQAPLWKFFLIGVAQSVAIIPGVSRSLATIFGGVQLGLSKKDAVLFSFLLAVPTIGAAGLYDLVSITEPIGPNILPLIVGFLTSFVVAYAVMQWFLRFIEKRSFSVFFWYRIALGSIILFFFV